MCTPGYMYVSAHRGFGTYTTELCPVFLPSVCLLVYLTGPKNHNYFNSFQI